MNEVPTQPIKARIDKGKMELKVKASAAASYLASLAGLTALGTVTDYVESLPDQIEVLVYPFVPALVSLAAGYLKRNRPGLISQSTREAVEKMLRH